MLTIAVVTAGTQKRHLRPMGWGPLNTYQPKADGSPTNSPVLVSNVAFSPPAPSATGITPLINGDKHLSGGFR